MTHFKIVCTGWKNWPWVKDTVASIEQQAYEDYDVCLVDDASGDPVLEEFIIDWCTRHRWNFIIQDEHKRATRNQVEAIRLMDPEPEDVIIWLDPDGDKFAHPNVLSRLDEAYSDGTRLLYSMYRPYPDSPGSTQSRAYPRQVIKSNSYRAHDRLYGIFWNHLRTMKADLFLQMDDSDFQTDDGTWFPTSCDSAFMYPGLELARGKVKFLPEVLVDYRADHDLSDWKRYPEEIDRIHHVILTRKPKC